MGVLDTAGNLLILWLMKATTSPNTIEHHQEPMEEEDQQEEFGLGPDPSDTYLQALHFAFALGGFVSPIIVGGLLSLNTTTTKTHIFQPLALGFGVIGLMCVPASIAAWILPSPPPPPEEEQPEQQEQEEQEEDQEQEEQEDLIERTNHQKRSHIPG
mmetsp:Transcript_22901/g.44599  ORF Transcript_22901/g.44599 Transcript_22901/m.44599 type:complete len:157 (+) Transcript_22901:57-527(+)